MEADRLGQLLRGDLDWIALQALRKEPDRRYESASSLAADVQRYLDRQPIQAHPPSTAYRMRKFVERHRMTVALIVALVAATLLASAFGWQRLELQAERERREAIRQILKERQMWATEQ